MYSRNHYSNHYWILDRQSLEVECTVCNAPVHEPCLTNKGLPHKQGYTHKGRLLLYWDTLKELDKC